MMSPLALLNEGETGEIIDHDAGMGHGHHHGHSHGYGYNGCCDRCNTCNCHGSTHRASDHLMNMGLRPGKKVKMLTNKGTGPLVLRVDECRIAMERGAAMKIYVRRNEG